MVSGTTSWSWPLGVACALLIGSLNAQTEPPITLELGGDSILLTDLPMRIFLPLTLSVAGDFRTSEISFGVSFPPRMTTFVEATKGPVAEAVQATVDTQLEKAQSGRRIVRFKISASEAIPEGELLKLTFDVSKAAGVEDRIILRIFDLTVKSADIEAPMKGKGTNGVITIEHVPLHACFFYMH